MIGKKTNITPFKEKAKDIASRANPSTMQVNITRKCNLACKHCHLSCSLSRKEDMDFDTANLVIEAFKSNGFKVLDITGGAPEMSNVFKYLIENLRDYAKNIIVRTNLSIYLEDGYDLNFLKENNIEVFASLPFYEKSKADKVRGDGNYDKSIIILKRLNEMGYGYDPNLRLNLVYNPAGAILPGNQKDLENLFKERLKEDQGVVFNNLYSVTNMPIGRFKDWLIRTHNYDRYMKKLEGAFNYENLKSLMCLDQISVDYNGDIYDCDFNLSIGLKAKDNLNIKDITPNFDFKRIISSSNHCYGCTAGFGSS